MLSSSLVTAFPVGLLLDSVPRYTRFAFRFEKVLSSTYIVGITLTSRLVGVEKQGEAGIYYNEKEFTSIKNGKTVSLDQCYNLTRWQ